MSEDSLATIITALISLLGIVVGAVLGYMGKTKKQSVLDAQREQRQSDIFDNLFNEMNEIKKRLDTHNKYAEKFGDIEKSIISIKKDIEFLRKEKNDKSN